MTGRIHSIQSLGAVDGPGLRCVVFFQGCPLRCCFCHNPDTWNFSDGEDIELEDLVKKVLRYRPYFNTTGGITVSGGEPLSQPDFLAEFFERLKRENVHTALDTSGICDLSKAVQALKYTDLVMCDIKFISDEEYMKNCGASLKAVEDFLNLTLQMNIPLWVRHVVIPGITDNPIQLAIIKEMAEKYANLEKIEWLPFHKMCEEKYKKMGIPFPLEDTPELSDERLKFLTSVF